MPETREIIAEEPKFTIVSDPDEVRALLKEEHRKEFAELLLEANLHHDDLSEETRLKLEAIGMPLDGKEVPKNHPVRSEDDWYRIHEHLADDYRELAEKGQLVLATAGGKVIGVSGFEGLGYKDKREVYEIKRTVVVPDNRGEGISSKLVDRVIQIIKSKSPEAYALSYTQRDQRKGNNSRRPSEKLSVSKYVDIDYPEGEEGRDEALERRTKKAERGWVAYLLDLKKD